MEKKDSKNLVNIKLTFLDLFPSLEEIDENNEGITINFQNSSFSYNLSELIKSLDEIFIPNQIPNQVIKVFLIKSDNIYATGPFTIKNGEQWITFTYEHKKKTPSNLALSLIDCIKIKFMCKMDFVISNPDNEIINNNYTNTEFPNKTDNNILAKPSPKKLYNNLTSKKKNGYMSKKAGIIGDPLDSLHTEESKISKIFENISTDLKNNEGNNALNNTTLPSNKKSHKNPLIKSENLSDFNPLAAYSGVVGKDFRLKGDKVKNIKKNSNNNVNEKKKNNNKLNDKQKSNNNKTLNNIDNNVDNNKPKSNLKRNRSKNLIDSNNKANKKEKQNKNNINNAINSNSNSSNKNESANKIKKENSQKNYIPKKEEETNEDSINNNIENINNKNINSNLLNQISNEIKDYSHKYKEDFNYFKDNDNYSDEISNLYQDNFSKKLEDFRLLYNSDYIQTIKPEDFSLEMELYIEKLIELISEYHLQIEEKEIEYQLLKNTYNKNIHQLSEQNKLSKKLQLIIEDHNIKESNKKSMNNHHDNNKINNLIANKAEINIFNFIIYSHKSREEKENKEKLKKILKNILNKPKHKNIINQNKKITKWIKLNMDKNESIKEKGKKRINTGKSQKSQIDDKDKGKNIKKKKNVNNVNNTPPKGKNKFNKK